jgi:ubiquitin-conjugating enzyme E2 J2
LLPLLLLLLLPLLLLSLLPQPITTMSSDICVRRLTKELAAMKKDPMTSPKITVAPNDANILEMHYVMEGSPGTPYEGGVYHGKLLFPKEYPLKPPSVLMLTPNGRFQPGRRLCLSMSDFHPETWNPMWCVSTILTGLYSFMIESKPTLGSIETTYRKKQQLAASSLEYNVLNDKLFGQLFPEYVERYEREKKEELLKQQQSLTTPISSSTTSPASSLAQAVGRPHHLGGPLIHGFVATLAGLAAIVSIVWAVRFL